MAELVVLQDVVASYGSLWVRVANSQGLGAVQIKDRFREQGFGEGAEELEVEGIDTSPVSGASRIFFRRAANNTKAEVHRLGAVMLQTDPVVETTATIVNVNAGATAYTFPQNDWSNGSASQDGPVAPASVTTSVEGTTEPLVKRGRGRPPGSKNKPKPAFAPVRVPTWPNV